jgi:alkanesulfonate monooxygenase SsuD/methylene tetrahydromethanopterin reductase-like flavin-dependent oxidoreductase (luciferase family)
MISLGITDHLEGSANRDSREIYREVSQLVQRADETGVRYFWFAEHHAHAHFGHMPTPLMFALHLAGQTKQIQLGSAIVCLNLHHALDVAEQTAVADVLSDGRIAPGFGSGSTPEEFALFGLPVTDDAERHQRFDEALTTIRIAWQNSVILPRAADDLPARSWIAVNSAGSARIAGKHGMSMLFSHLRTPEQYLEYVAAYRTAGGRGLIAINRPVYVGRDDASAEREASNAVRTLWRRFKREGKIDARIGTEPSSLHAVCQHPLNFIVGGPETVARQLNELHDRVLYDVANLEVRWEGLSHELTLQSLTRLAEEVASLLKR